MPVQARAEELFHNIFRLQVKQKEGAISMKKTHKQKDKKRLKFSKKKQFVAVCLHRAFKEQRITKWDCKSRFCDISFVTNPVLSALSEMNDHSLTTPVITKCLK